MRLLIAVFVCASTLLGCSVAQTPVGGLSGSHPEVPRWCGKPYNAGSPNFNPGGNISAPTPSSKRLLSVKVEPRHSIYDSSESHAELIIDAAVSRHHGHPYQTTWPHTSNFSFPEFLDFTVHVEESKQLLAAGAVEINTTGNLFPFLLTSLAPKLSPYHIRIVAHLFDGRAQQTFSHAHELYYLPAKRSGSTVKVDNLYGGLLVANNVSDYAFKPLFPFGFYTSCSQYLQTSLQNVTAYKELGFNAINPVCDLFKNPISYMFDWLDQVNLWYQFDMRNAFMNLTQTAQQVELIKDRSNLLQWYTADEPDGWQYALNQTKITYDLIKSLDPYHPVALVLNCENYYFEEYSSGTDIIMEDAYPVGIDPTYNKHYKVPCNDTYGDCGCDNCAGTVHDVAHRLDVLREYHHWLGLQTKPLWAVLQAFSGEDYWSRDPTPEETWVMLLLSFNHAAKGIMSWLFPSSNVLNHAHGALAQVATVAPVSTFLLGAAPKPLAAPLAALDVAFWDLGRQLLISVANTKDESTAGPLTLTLPKSVAKIDSQPWSKVQWEIKANTSLVAPEGLAGLATSLLILDKTLDEWQW